MGGFRSSGIGSKGSSVSPVERHSSTYSPLKKAITSFEKLDEAKKAVATKEAELAKAKQDLADTELSLQAQLASIDPVTRDSIKAMLGLVEETKETGGPIR